MMTPRDSRRVGHVMLSRDSRGKWGRVTCADPRDGSEWVLAEEWGDVMPRGDYDGLSKRTHADALRAEAVALELNAEEADARREAARVAPGAEPAEWEYRA